MSINGLTQEAAQQKPDLIVWPATSLPGPPQINRLVGYTVRDIARSAGAYLLVGGAGYDKVAPKKKGYLPFSNSEYLIRPTGGGAGQYNKMHLLAFNEYVPLQGTNQVAALDHHPAGKLSARRRIQAVSC